MIEDVPHTYIPSFISILVYRCHFFFPSVLLDLIKYCYSIAPTVSLVLFCVILCYLLLSSLCM